LVCNGFVVGVLWICMDLLWVCIGFAIDLYDLHCICCGFAQDLYGCMGENCIGCV
jgi:hypothetical protein